MISYEEKDWSRVSGDDLYQVLVVTDGKKRVMGKLLSIKKDYGEWVLRLIEVDDVNSEWRWFGRIRSTFTFEGGEKLVVVSGESEEL